MTAADRNQKLVTLGAHAHVDRLHPMGVLASTHIYLGTMIALTLAGYLVPASADPSLRVVGYSESESDNSSGSSGALTQSPCRGAILLQNSGTTDAITDADVGRRCYVVDDRTVARTSALGARPCAGRVVAVISTGVYVEVGADVEGDGVIDLFVPAGADLSTKQYYAVELGSGGTVTVNNAAGEAVLGILQNAPASGAIAIVRIFGRTKWIASTTIATGVRLATTNAGKSKAAANTTADASGASATAALTGSNVAGISLSDGAADTAHLVMLMPQGAVPGTAA